jgi:glucose/arabinose dehydrogenase
LVEFQLEFIRRDILINPGPGSVYIGDVGSAEYEEINVVRRDQGGKNFGWPWYVPFIFIF